MEIDRILIITYKILKNLLIKLKAF